MGERGRSQRVYNLGSLTLKKKFFDIVGKLKQNIQGGSNFLPAGSIAKTQSTVNSKKLFPRNHGSKINFEPAIFNGKIYIYGNAKICDISSKNLLQVMKTWFAPFSKQLI